MNHSCDVQEDLQQNFKIFVVHHTVVKVRFGAGRMQWCGIVNLSALELFYNLFVHQYETESLKLLD